MGRFLSPRLSAFILTSMAVAGVSRVAWSYFASDLSMSRGYCVHWNWSFLMPYIIANSVIGVAYFGIPSLLAYYLKKQGAKDQPIWITVCFIAFIILCGTGHWIEVVNVFHPMYGPMLVVDGLTALASIGTAIALPFGIAHLLATPSRQALQAVIDDMNGVKVQVEKAVEAIEPVSVPHADEIMGTLQGIHSRLTGMIERTEVLTYRRTGDA